MIYALLVLAGLVVGGLVGWFVALSTSAKRSQVNLENAQQRANAAESKSSALEGTLAELRRQNESAAGDFDILRSNLLNEQSTRVQAETRLTETMQRLEEEKKLLEEARTKLTDAFKAVAGDTLSTSTSEFLKLAKETFDKILTEAKGDLGKRQEAINGLVKPLSDSLGKFDEHLRLMENARLESYKGLTEQVKALSTSQQQLQKETGNLVTALRKPEVRGRWGEMTLRRVVELAGMSEHCDFCEQVSTNTEEGRVRPDLVIYLPSDREIVVDSKVPLDAYLDANSSDNEEARKSALNRHAKHIRDHMNGLADKKYWTQFTKSPDFVVMFIPGDSFFGAAVDVDPTLIEDALQRHIVIATPATLIALIRAVAYGWRQELITKNAQEISDLGKQLYERMRILAEHISDVGGGLERANSAYNKAASSLESRVLPAARRFKDLGAATGEEITFLQNIQGNPRQINSQELTKPLPEDKPGQ
jgi:DNA recombination protein RmuC